MSDKAKGRVWDMEIPHNQQFVLLAMLDHADHIGQNMYPGHDLIAHKTNYAEDTVIRIVEQLLQEGILVLDNPNRRPSKSNPYHVNWNRCTFKPEFVRQTRGRPRKRTDETSVNYEKEPITSPKRTDISPVINRHSEEKEPTFSGKEPISPRLPHALNLLTIKEPIEPRGNILPLPKKIEYDPTRFIRCEGEKTCNTMIDPAYQLDHLCPDCRRRGRSKVTPMYPRSVK